MLTLCVIALAVLAVGLWPVGRRPARWPLGNPAAEPGQGRLGALRARGRVGKDSATKLEPVLAELVAVLAAPLRSGVAPSLAIAAAEPAFRADAALGPLLEDLRSAAAGGDGVADVWLAHAASWQSPDLRFVGQAWALTERTGAPLADALACAEGVLRARARGRQRLATAAAGPRASMGVLCLLPLSGPLVGVAFGMGPGQLYLSSPIATASVVMGLLLATGSWWWSRRIIARAS